MVNVDKATIAKYKSHGHSFEILVDCDSALAFRQGKVADVWAVLAAQRIFSDAKKGIASSENAMKETFGTSDAIEVAKLIIQKGEIPLSTEYKEKLREQKKRQIINYIHINAVDPKTHFPHPVQRIESAMAEAKVRIDEFQDVQRQVQEVIKRLREILPLKFEIKEMEVRVPAEFAPKAYNVINTFGKKLSEEWLNDGSLKAVIEMPGGMEEEFHR